MKKYFCSEIHKICYIKTFQILPFNFRKAALVKNIVLQATPASEYL